MCHIIHVHVEPGTPCEQLRALLVHPRPTTKMDSIDAVQSFQDGDPEAISILEVQVHKVTTPQTLDLVRRFMDESKLHQIATVNPEFIMSAQKDDAFRQVLNASDLCLPDGIGLLLAARWQGTPLEERVAGSDLVYLLASEASKNGWKLFLLGAGPGVAEEAADILRTRYPGLLISGTYSGSPSMVDNEAIVSRINESGADMLYVAYGAPSQDLWIARNRETLKKVRVAMGVGGSLDFITGRSARAPVWLQRIGLEWFYRLLREPWRWKRMLALPKFAINVFLSRR